MDKAFLKTLIESCYTEHRMLDHVVQGLTCYTIYCEEQLTERIVDKLNMILNP